jgi:hypothetical protein
MATSAITGLTTEQELARQKLAHERGQTLFGGLGSMAYSLIDPTDPLTYLGLFGKVGRAAAIAGMGMSPTDAEAVVGSRFKTTGKPVSVPMYGRAYEIPDNFSSLNPQALEKVTKAFGGGGKLKEILSHPSLYRDYPELSNLDVKTLGLFSNPATRAAYGDQTIFLPPTKSTTAEGRLKELHSSLLHEVQHAIQEIDKMPKGSNPSYYLPENFLNSFKAAQKSVELSQGQVVDYLAKNYDGRLTYGDVLFKTKKFEEAVKKDKQLEDYVKQHDYTKKLSKKLVDKQTAAHDTYERVAGEAQSRAVQKRFENPEQYDRPFSESYDVDLLDLTRSPLDRSID